MRARPWSVVVAVMLGSASFAPVGGGGSVQVDAQSAPGRILAPAGRQLAWLSLEAPRPRPITRFDQPSYVADVGASPAGAQAIVPVAEPLQGTRPLGTDLLAVDLASGQLSMLVERSGNESLGAPAWWPDSGSVLFERQAKRGDT